MQTAKFSLLILAYSSFVIPVANSWEDYARGCVDSRNGTAAARALLQESKRISAIYWAFNAENAVALHEYSLNRCSEIIAIYPTFVCPFDETDVIDANNFKGKDFDVEYKELVVIMWLVCACSDFKYCGFVMNVLQWKCLECDKLLTRGFICNFRTYKSSS